VTCLDSIVVMGYSQVTEQALRLAARGGVDIIHSTNKGQTIAITSSFSSKGTLLRMQQYKAYFDESKRLTIAKYICGRKLEAQEQYLKQRRAIPFKDRHVFKQEIIQLADCTSVNQVLGVEGHAANYYFKRLKTFSSFTKRSKRPAIDIINALMNLSYSLILHRICGIAVSYGFDTQVGFLHSLNDRRPSLALDLLELFRAQADAFVVTITNRQEFTRKDFIQEGGKGGFLLSQSAFSRFIQKFTDQLLQELEIDREVSRLRSLLLEGEVD